MVSSHTRTFTTPSKTKQLVSTLVFLSIVILDGQMLLMSSWRSVLILYATFWCPLSNPWSQGINPLLVFDGGELPTKNFTKQQRQKRVNEAVDNYNQLMLKHGQPSRLKHTPIPSSKQIGRTGQESAFTVLLK